MDKRVANGCACCGKAPFVRGLVRWVGFRQTSGVCPGRAGGGETKYPLKKMLALATDGISFSYKPLKLAGYAGSPCLCELRLPDRKDSAPLRPADPAGWASLMAIILFSNGIILIMLGIL